MDPHGSCGTSIVFALVDFDADVYSKINISQEIGSRSYQFFYYCH